jgi:SP family myo-inositol transporter-like MFS transporter 13
MAIKDEKKVDIETEHTESIEPELGAVSQIDDDVLSIEEVAASKAAWLISITVSLGGYTCIKDNDSGTVTDDFRFLFGYDTGYISSVLVTIGTSLGHVLSTSEQELVTSLTSGGALVGAVGSAGTGYYCISSGLMTYRSELDSQPIASDEKCPSGPLVWSSLSERSFKLLRTR